MHKIVLRGGRLVLLAFAISGLGACSSGSPNDLDFGDSSAGGAAQNDAAPDGRDSGGASVGGAAGSSGIAGAGGHAGSGAAGVGGAAGSGEAGTGGNAGTGGVAGTGGNAGTGGTGGTAGTGGTGGGAPDAGSDGAACSDICILNNTMCSGVQVQTCAMKLSGCTDWGPAASCPNGGVCSGNACVSPCTTGNMQCVGNLLEICNSSHQWMTQQVCAQSCDPGTTSCVGAATCTANERRCDNLQAQVCNSTGTAWLNVESCLVACSNGLCTGTCTPGDTRCDGQTPETCNSTGTAWTSQAACSTFCYKGACALDSLTIDANANATLEGENVYAGDVTIKNSSVLTSTTGKLIIRANNVILDSTSKIIILPTGDDPRGRGASGGASVYCTPGYYCSASFGIGGGGGGFGVAGTTSSNVYTCNSYYGYTCTQNKAGGSVFGIADNELATGSAGGACDSTPGGKGGGYLGIYANNIQIAGQITANGAAGSSCSGGGSGGEVLLNATGDLTFSGSISAAGAASGGTYGAGAGGNGVVKALYGNTKTITGSTIGASFQSYMPAFDMSSSTHPRQDLWYNDGYTALDIAWSQPFTSTAGYYRILNQTYGFVPTTANSIYQDGEAIEFLPTSLVAGTNYFHTTTLGPFANLGTVESRYIININSTPPTVSSSSHPSQTAWYANSSPYLSWTLPQAVANTSNFYWVFDNFFETVPTTSSAQIPMDLVTPQNSEQILLPNNANGIWFFHIISQDTMGYLTKNAALYKVMIGTNPGMGSMSGSVTDASTSQFLSGVQISLNRGLQTATTNGSGVYALSNNVVAIQYEVRARKAGYQDSIQTVTVTQNLTSTVNFMMTQ